MGRKIWFVVLTLLFMVSLFPLPTHVEAAPTQNPSSIVGTSAVNWSAFWQTFKAFSVWDLEWHNGVSWVSVKSDLTVIRDYPEPNHVKVTLIFDASQSGDYRLTFAIDKRVKNYVEKTNQYQYNLTYDGFSVIFDWSDVLSVPNLQVSHGVLNNYFWFRLRRDNVPQGAHIEIDPSVVATTESVNGTHYSIQHKVFRANGRFWVFYSDGTDGVFKTSLDGSTWSTVTTFKSGIMLGHEFSVWFNGTYMHYAHATTGDIYYRRGTPEANGTITWSDSEQTAFSSSNTTATPVIIIDDSGYPFIGYWEEIDMIVGTPQITSSDLNNGTWNTRSSFPFELNSTAKDSWSVIPVPLTEGNIYVAYARANIVYGRLWNSGGPGSWGSIETATTHSASSYRMSLVATEDDVHLVYVNTTTYEVLYKKRVSSWGSDTDISNGTSSFTAPVLTVDPDTYRLYAIWTYDDDVYYRTIDSDESLGTIVTWIEETDLDERSITSFYQLYDRSLGYAYMQGTGSPWNIKFACGPGFYVFHGPFSETTGLRTYDEVNVNVYFDELFNYQFTLNGTAYEAYPAVPLYFEFGFSNTRQYWLGDNEEAATIYVFDASTTVYTIAFYDLAGALDDYPFVEVSRYINGTLHIVEKRKVDVEKKISASLINGATYTITIKDGSSYTYGDLVMTSITTVQLTLKGIDFPKETLLVYPYVRIYFTRRLGASGTGNITITYQDTLEQTTSVDIFINYKNGTNVYNATETADSFVHVWASALNNTDYAVVVDIDHQRFGTYTVKQYMPRSFSIAPWGLGWFGSLPFDTSIIIPALLIIFAAGAFSQINAEVGAFMAVVTAALLTYMGWIAIEPGALITGVALAFLMAIIYGKRRVQT